MGCRGRTTQVHTGMQSEAQRSWDVHEVGRRPLRLEQREGERALAAKRAWPVLCRIQGGKRMRDVPGGNVLASGHRTDCTWCRRQSS